MTVWLSFVDSYISHSTTTTSLQWGANFSYFLGQLCSHKISTKKINDYQYRACAQALNDLGGCGRLAVHGYSGPSVLIFDQLMVSSTPSRAVWFL